MPGAVVIDLTIIESAAALTGKLREISTKPESADAAIYLEIFTTQHYLDSQCTAS